MNGQSSHSLLILIRVGICNLETERVLEQGLAWDCMGLQGIAWDYLELKKRINLTWNFWKQTELQLRPNEWLAGGSIVILTLQRHGLHGQLHRLLQQSNEMQQSE